MDGLIEGASSLASNDNVPSSSTPTVSKKPEVKGTLESFGTHVQQSGARMARGLTVNLLAGDDPRDVVIKTIAAFAAEVVCFGVAEGYQGFACILGQDPNAAARAANTAVHENSFSMQEPLAYIRTEIEVEELEAALAQETNPEKREQLEEKLSWRRGMLQTRDDQQAEYARLGEKYLGPICDWGLSEIENETYRRIAGNWNTTLDGVHSWTSDMREFHSPLVLDGLNIGSTLSGIDFAADLFKLPTTKGGAVLFAMPMATTAFSVLKTAGRGTINSLRNVPIFDVRNSAPVFDILTQTTSGFKVTQHGVLRKIEREVKSCDILDALKIGNIKIDNLGRASQRYIGFGAEVAINPYTKKILSTNKIGRKKLKRLLNE